MKKNINWMLMTLLVVGLGMNLASCKDDEMSEEEKAWHEADPYEKGSEEAVDFWTVISQLTDLQTLPDNWKTATYEPTIGEASDTDPYTRIVVVQDAAEAVAAYSCLIGLAESLPDYTSGNNFSNNRVGTLNYSRSRDGQSVATVEVNIKQMPSLKKIVYMTPEQAGENATLHGSAYYHFGDVISRVRPEDGVKEYWICVNPASHLTGKTTSHWISVSDLPAKNVYTWTRSDDVDVVLPTAICTQYTYIHDFATMLKAMLDSKQYFANIGQNGLTTFTGFSTKPSYINQYYFERINDAWQKKDLYSQVLYTTNDELKNRQELDIFCKGYSWVMGKTGTLYTYTYSGPNWKTATWKKRTYDFKDTGKPAFNIHLWGIAGKGNSNWEPHNAYVVRYTTGEALCKLAGTNYSWQTAISGCEDVYVYNKYWYDGNGYDMNAAPEILNENSYKPQSKGLSEVTKDDRGKFIGQNGRIYDTKEAAERDHTKAVALVIDVRNTDYTALIGSKSTEFNNSHYEDFYFIKHGIGIALENGRSNTGNNAGQDYPCPENERTEVSDYDKDWYEAHKTSVGKWYVPCAYHWQRMILPYGRKTIQMPSYLYENMNTLIQGYDNLDLKGSEEFVNELKKAGAALEYWESYVVAGSRYFIEGDNIELPTYAVRSTNVVEWSAPMAGNYTRYVLVW
jgi:hypothetical protein